MPLPVPSPEPRRLSNFQQFQAVSVLVRNAPCERPSAPQGPARPPPARPARCLQSPLSDSLLADVSKLPGAYPEQIYVLRANPMYSSELEKLNLERGGHVGAGAGADDCCACRPLWRVDRSGEGGEGCWALKEWIG